MKALSIIMLIMVIVGTSLCQGTSQNITYYESGKFFNDRGASLDFEELKERYPPLDRQHRKLFRRATAVNYVTHESRSTTLIMLGVGGVGAAVFGALELAQADGLTFLPLLFLSAGAAMGLFVAPVTALSYAFFKPMRDKSFRRVADYYQGGLETTTLRLGVQNHGIGLSMTF
jgi:hypothetical protein